MPRRATGPKLALYGPDNKHGAKPKKGFAEYIWYIVWRENGARKERSTGAGLDHQDAAEKALAAFLIERTNGAAPAGGYRPHEVTVEAVLQKYAAEQGGEAKDAERISYGIQAMIPFWSGKLLSEVGQQTCIDYRKWRTKQTTKNYKRSLDAWERRRDEARKLGKTFTEAGPAKQFASIRTARTELEYLRAAIVYCRSIPFITDAPIVTLPEKGDPREVWLTRSDYAKVLLEARKPVAGKPNARRHLIVYLKVALYQPARKEAILTLPLVQQIDGGPWIDAKNGVIDFGPGSGNKKRPRRVPIHPRILVYVRGAARRNQKYLIEMVGPVKGANGRPSRKKTRQVGDVRHSFAKAVKRAALGKRVTPHTLRHTGVTWLKHKGQESWMVAQYAGMTKETVDRIYAHSPEPDAMNSIIDALRKK